MLIGLATAGGIITIIIISFIIYINNERRKRIKENTRINTELIEKLYKEIEKDGVKTLKKTKDDEAFIPKNEMLYDKAVLSFYKRRVLQSGKVKETSVGHGTALISDKAITVETFTLKSGKRRFLYKNISGDMPIVSPTEMGIRVGFYYNENNYIFLDVSEIELKTIVKVFFLKNNPMKNSNAISF